MVARVKTKRYVLLPARGLVSDALEAEFLNHEGLALSVSDMRWALSKSYGTASALQWRTMRELDDGAGDGSRIFRVLQSVEDDGPKLVEASATAERLLRASGLRLLPLTRYRLATHGEPDVLSGPIAAAAAARDDFLRHLLADGTGTGARGKGVTVGIVDTGVDSNHPDLRDAVTGGRCTVLDDDVLDHQPAEGEKGSHGTHVAGIIGGRGLVNGVTGVAPEARLRSYRVFPKSGAPSATNASIISAIRAAVEDECDIVNLSLGGSSAKEDGVRDAIDYAWQNGTVCIAAAGNGGRKSVSYPARHPNAIAVSAVGNTRHIPVAAVDRQFVADPFAATDPDVFLASFSNIGPQIDFTAPGVWIVSTMPGGHFAAMSGTSMAAPAVSGFAAIALSRAEDILTRQRNTERAEAVFGLLVGSARQYGLGSFDFEGYGVPLP